MQKIIEYYRKCYQADRGRKSLWNLLSKDIDHLHFLDFSQIRTVDGVDCSVDGAYFSALQKTLETYRREKTLLYCNAFIIGKTDVRQFGGKRKSKIFAPLFYTEIQQKLEDNHVIHIENSTVQWNIDLLYWLLGGKEEAEKFEASVMDSFDLELAGNLLPRLLNGKSKQRLVPIDTPIGKFDDVDGLYTQLDENEIGIACYSSAFAVVKNSFRSRGILDELFQLQDRTDSSAPLKRIFSRTPETNTSSTKCDPKLVPGSLSQAQSSILKNASRYQLSVLKGPPGTGKSYTIAAIALESCLRGERVLLVSNNEHAVDVLHEKLLQDFSLAKNLVMRAGTHTYFKELRKYIASLLTANIAMPQTKKLQQAFSRADKDLEKLWLKYYNDLRAECDFSEQALLPKRLSLFGWVDSLLTASKVKARRKNGTFHEQYCKINMQKTFRDKQLARWKATFLEGKIAKAVKKNRAKIDAFRQAIASRTSQLQTKRFLALDFDTILDAMPIWLCSLDTLHRAIPLQANLFDLVIVDEASQCDIPSSLPALYRAKRALIVGDNKQLRHVSFLSRTRQDIILEECNINFDLASYRDKSLFDLALEATGSDGKIIELDEHFRSQPNIIKFSNSHFYDNRLKVMTENPYSLFAESVEIVQVKDAERDGTTNLAEANAIVALIHQFVSEQAILPAQFKATVGILSFFRDQADFLTKLVQSTVSQDSLRQHNIKVGTPYSFQGMERDIMLISTVVDRHSKAGSYSYLNRPEVFNVGITRAKQKVILFLSLPPESIPNGSLLSHYVSDHKNSEPRSYEETYQASKQVQDLLAAITRLEFRTYTGYPIAGVQMDCLVVKADIIIGIELIGFPGEEGAAVTRETYESLRRARVPIMPIAFSDWLSQPDLALDQLTALFEKIKQAQSHKSHTIVKQTLHWPKLLQTHPQLVSLLKMLEDKLTLAGLVDEYKLLGEFVDSFVKTIWVLGQKLNPDELTYLRGKALCENILLAGLDNFNDIYQWSRGVNQLSVSANLDDAGSPLKHETNPNVLRDEICEAIRQLVEFANQWVVTDTGKNLSEQSLKESIVQLKNASNEVHKYKVTDR